MKAAIPNATDTDHEIISVWPHYTFEGALEASNKIQWRVEDLIGGDKRLDFTKPFLPESLARVEPLDFLSAKDRLVLNQIRGHDYPERFFAVQQQAVRWTYLGSGMSHGKFLATADLVKPGSRTRLEQVAPLFS